jgi:hypothetical protein
MPSSVGQLESPLRRSRINLASPALSMLVRTRSFRLRCCSTNGRLIPDESERGAVGAIGSSKNDGWLLKFIAASSPTATIA